MIRRIIMIDTGIAALAFTASLVVLAFDGFGTPAADVRHLDGLGVLLTLATALPLVARRRAPITVAAVTIAATAVLYWLGYAFDLAAGPGVAVYTLGAVYGGDPRPVRRRLALQVAMAFAPAAAVAYAARGDSLVLVPEMAGLLLCSAGLWLLGDRARMRRERMAALEERAERVERDAERERRLAAAEERTRIARELHDAAGHAINVILVQAGAARLLQDRDPAGARRAIATIEDVARDTIGEIDQIVRALRGDGEPPPPPPDAAALDELVARHRAGGLRIAADLPAPAGALPRGVAWAAYRILQEALTNAARHGRGSAEVAMRFDASAVEVSVANPFVGSGARAGHGIAGMRERATLLGGTLTTAAEQGVFRLHAHLPYGGGP
ncbi:histidine kinase [Actinomycetes bacterium KLBMP 9797]